MFGKKLNRTESENMFIHSFIKRSRYVLFPKLETIIKQAEDHFESGDLDLCKDILNLMWRTIDKAEADMKDELLKRVMDPIEYDAMKEKECAEANLAIINQIKEK